MRALHAVCLSVLAAVASAVELPVAAVTVLPGGLIIERAGQVPAGDEVLSGLPAGLDEGSLSVAIDGREADGWRLVRSVASAAQPGDPAAQHALAVAERALGVAELRAGLAAAADAAAGGADRPVLPSAEAIRARVAFAAANAGQAARESQAATEASEAALATLTIAPPPAGAPPALHVPGMGGKAVRLRYFVSGAAWTPAWRLEVEGADAILVQLAVITLPAGLGLPAVPLTVATHGRSERALLPDPQVPVLGLRESLELELPPPEMSACEVTAVNRTAAAVLRDPAAPLGDQLVHLLGFLGAGYDHKTPNKYRKQVGQALERVQRQDPARLGLSELAFATMALGEADAMTGDAALRPAVGSFLASLRQRWPRELPVLVASSGAQAGPRVAAQVAMAIKSCLAAGLETGDDLSALRSLPLGGGEEAELAGLVIDVFAGGREPALDDATAQRWSASFDRWWAEGRVELIHFATLAAFQRGGEVWQTVSAMRDRLVQLQLPDGRWPLDQHPLGRNYASGIATLAMEVYYRYAQVQGTASRQAAAPPPSRPPPRWPVRQAAARPVALVPGGQTVELRRCRLAGSIAWEATPVLSPGVWRRLSAANPWAAPLPAGPVEVVADGRHLGTAEFADLAPDATMAIDLGPDDRLRVQRTARAATDDGMFKRTLVMTVSCRLEAPAGWSQPVLVREPLPQPQDGDVEVEMLRPERLASGPYGKRLERDASVTATLTATAPESVLAELRLTYPRSLRPRLEAR